MLYFSKILQMNDLLDCIKIICDGIFMQHFHRGTDGNSLCYYSVLYSLVPLKQRGRGVG